MTYDELLTKQGFFKADQADIVTGREYWQRRTKYPVPLCQLNGKPFVNVYINRVENHPTTYEVEIAGESRGNFWATLTAVLPESVFFKSLGETEHRLADAWREMS